MWCQSGRNCKPNMRVIEKYSLCPLWYLPLLTILLMIRLYYSLSAVSVVVLVYTMILGLKKRTGLPDATSRNQAFGVALAALGFAVSILTGVVLDTLTKRAIITNLLYQQLHFPIFYVGVAMVLFGIDSSLLTAQKSIQSQSKKPESSN